MSTLLTAQDLTKSFAQNTLFTGVGCQFVEGDRVGVIGPNGAGKSTLLRILADLEQADGGDVTRRRQLRLAYVPQDDRFDPDALPHDVVVAAADPDAPSTLDADTRAAITLSKLGFEGDKTCGALSGGWKKRLSIACALVDEPDVLLLDEPTNHLDLEGVLWLEQFVRQAKMAIGFITHDRTFLENVATRIIELSRAYPGGTFEVKGNYTEFVRRKEAFLEAQAQQQQQLANTVRRDTAWLRQGIQGRQTRNKTQVADAADRRAELKELKTRNTAPTKTTTIDFQSTDRKTRKLLGAHNISKSLGGRLLFSDLDVELSPGMRVGLLGTNGSGKTTLLRVLSGALEPDTGTVKPAAEARIVTFSQHRETLDPNDTLQTALCPVGDIVDYRGKQVHVTGWARRFLFDTEQLSTPVGLLSGGEQARVLIANLMLSPADILLLDEPTNDLDIPSLEVLEDAVSEFPGAIILVTHDRFMLERLATELIALDGEGGAKSFVSLDQWQRYETERRKTAKAENVEAKSKPREKPKPATRKLTYAEQLELEKMDDAILEAESAVETLQARVNDPDQMADHVAYGKLCEELSTAQSNVEALYERWTELDSLR